VLYSKKSYHSIAVPIVLARIARTSCRRSSIALASELTPILPVYWENRAVRLGGPLPMNQGEIASECAVIDGDSPCFVLEITAIGNACRHLIFYSVVAHAMFIGQV
jgi:hypothetical protein